MKKCLALCLSLICLATVAVRADTVTVTNRGQVFTVNTFTEGTNAANAEITLSGSYAYTRDVKIDSLYAVVGPQATNGLLVAYGTVTATDAAAQTNLFGVTFASAPVVTCTYTEDPGDVRPIYVTSTSTTGFNCTVTADKNFQWIAVGLRP